MFKIYTKIDTSTIPNAGLGVFTGQKIKKGEIVWEFNSSTTISFNNDFLKEMPSILKEMFFKHTELYKNNRVHHLDDSAFMNHSDQPNTKYQFEFKNIFQEDIKVSLIASKDIEIGEELLYNYYDFDEEADLKLK